MIILNADHKNKPCTVLVFDNVITCYYSDKPGKHDFKILRKLVLPDGSVLRAKYAGRPTRDCLFVDPVMDGTRYSLSSLSLSLTRNTM